MNLNLKMMRYRSASNICSKALSARSGNYVTTSKNSVRVMSSSSAKEEATPLSSFTEEKMKVDKRYKPTTNVPESLLKEGDAKNTEYNIRGKFLEGRPSYLDMSSTTPLDPRVLDAMLPYSIGSFGNPHSRTHSYGWEAEKAVEKAREDIAALIGASSKEIIFTSGATESNNMSVKGIAHFYSKSNPEKKHIITTQTEHKCVLDSCRFLEQEGFEVTYLPVLPSTGRICMKQLEEAVRPGQTVLVSVMAVNNEIGTRQPLEDIGRLCKENKIFFHTDGAQMLGKLPIDVQAMNIDLMSLSSHKIYGPKGIGALYVRRSKPRVRLDPLFSGGGQERGLRSGTLPHSLCVGFGAACAIAKQEHAYDTQWTNFLSKKLQNGIETRIPYVVRNGDPEHNYPGCLNYSFAYVEGESLLMSLKNIAISSGSACTSASLEPSYVLRALGVGEDLAHSSLRFGIGRFTTEEEIDFMLDLIEIHVKRLRDMSPLYEMVQEGIDLTTIQWTQDAHHH